VLTLPLLPLLQLRAPLSSTTDKSASAKTTPSSSAAAAAPRWFRFAVKNPLTGEVVPNAEVAIRFVSKATAAAATSPLSTGVAKMRNLFKKGKFSAVAKKRQKDAEKAAAKLRKQKRSKKKSSKSRSRSREGGRGRGSSSSSSSNSSVDSDAETEYGSDDGSTSSSSSHASQGPGGIRYSAPLAVGGVYERPMSATFQRTMVPGLPRPLRITVLVACRGVDASHDQRTRATRPQVALWRLAQAKDVPAPYDDKMASTKSTPTTTAAGVRLHDWLYVDRSERSTESRNPVFSKEFELIRSSATECEPLRLAVYDAHDADGDIIEPSEELGSVTFDLAQHLLNAHKNYRLVLLFVLFLYIYVSV
jgi:hypothetical protein